VSVILQPDPKVGPGREVRITDALIGACDVDEGSGKQSQKET
jgi:hypothetical protein